MIQTHMIYTVYISYSLSLKHGSKLSSQVAMVNGLYDSSKRGLLAYPEARNAGQTRLRGGRTAAEDGTNRTDWLLDGPYSAQSKILVDQQFWTAETEKAPLEARKRPYFERFGWKSDAILANVCLGGIILIDSEKCVWRFSTHPYHRAYSLHEYLLWHDACTLRVVHISFHKE